ncbi:MAG TPA: hypothetical protein PKC76_15020 [Saprospiraceae bacterium]|nr:hypothetical protein [Saprospiraceae bacterium]HMP25445.1 hypothetical protein [Saprospiraceae bacterium]
MNRIVVVNALRFIFLLLAQTLVLKRMTLWSDGFQYFQILLYPLFILLLPIGTPRALVLVLAMAMGLGVDVFYDSPGVHASALVFTGFIRYRVLRWLTPANGYGTNPSPTKARLGPAWFLRYTAIMFGVHLFFYFSVEYFTFVYLGDILLKTVGSFSISVFFVLMIMQIFNPKD